MKKLEKFKVTSKRGRPKKRNIQNKANKFFQIPERYQMPAIDTKGLQGKDQETMLILETSENLGLSQVYSRERTLKEIKTRLLK